MPPSRRSSTQKELAEHAAGEPPKEIYHGTKHFWRQRTELDLHIYQCAKQFTVVPFHKERHEEFESLYLDRAKLEEIMLSEKKDDLLDQFGADSAEKSSESSSSSMEAFMSGGRSSHAAQPKRLTADAVAKYIMARVNLVDPLPEPEPEPEPEPDPEPEPVPAGEGGEGGEGGGEGGEAASAAEDAGGAAAAAEEEGAPAADAAVDAETEPAADAMVALTMARAADAEEQGSVGPALHIAVSSRRVRGCELVKLTGDAWDSLEHPHPDRHTFSMDRMHKDHDLGSHFDGVNASLKADADELAKQRAKAKKFSSAARLALTAFDDLLSKVRGESAEDKAANALRAKLRMRRAEKGGGGGFGGMFGKK